MKNQIAASILSANFAELGKACQQVLAAGADRIHFDVMDNHYVPNLTIGPLVCQALRDYGITAPIDVHLMVLPVDALIKSFAKAGASIITFHPEASQHIDRSLTLIRELGCRAGLAFNPATPLNYLDYLWEKLDEILIMSVNPGFAGQAFITNSLKKIQQLKQQLHDRALSIDIAVDGGIQLNNIQQVKQAGANIFVMGSAIFNASTDYATTLKQLKQLLTTV